MRTVLLLAAVSAADAFAPAAFHLASAPVARNFCKPPASAGLRMAKDAKEGLFSPVVRGAKVVLGDKALNSIRGKVIAKHSEVISAFCESAESDVGKIALKQLYRLADVNNDGVLCQEDLKSALTALGFYHLSDKQIMSIFKRADKDGNMELDWEEFMEEAPRSLRTNLILLAKTNGNELGFLS